MVAKILDQYGKVLFAYLAGPPYDIYKVYLAFDGHQYFRIELKHPFYMIRTPEEQIDAALENLPLNVYMYRPADAYVKLIHCDYKDPEGWRPVVEPNKITYQTVLNLLLESV